MTDDPIKVGDVVVVKAPVSGAKAEMPVLLEVTAVFWRDELVVRLVDRVSRALYGECRLNDVEKQ